MITDVKSVCSLPFITYALHFLRYFYLILYFFQYLAELRYVTCCSVYCMVPESELIFFWLVDPEPRC